MPEMQQIPENFKMSFNGQPNIIFGKIISCTKAKNFEPIGHNFLIKWLKK
jgi:hypothetical protein